MTHQKEVLPYLVVVLLNCVFLGQCYCPDGCSCSRTVQCNVKEINKVIPFLPRNISRLDLSSSQIVHIPNGVFSNLTNLEYLSLANNSIEKLHKDSLRGLRKLKELHLQHNPLSAFGTFSHTPALRILRLEGNINASLLRLGDLKQLTNITVDLFSNSTCNRCHFFRSPSNICLHDPTRCVQLKTSPFPNEDCTCATCTSIDPNFCRKSKVTNRPTWSVLGSFVAARVLFWLFGTVALTSNLLMLVALCVSIHFKRSTKGIFIINLTLCNIFISSHVVVIATLDYVTYDNYKENGKGLWEQKWCTLIFLLKHCGLLSGMFCLVLIALERYIAICHYGNYTRRISLCKALGYAIECWVLGCTLTIVIWFVSSRRWNYLCSVDLGTTPFYNISYVIKYITSAVCIITVIVCLRMYKKTLTTGHKASLGKESKDALRMSAITLSSLLFWTFPYMGFVMVSVFIPDAFSVEMAETAMTLTVTVMATLHPLFYAYRNQRFRTCFNILLCKKGSCLRFHCGWIHSCCSNDAYEQAEFEVDSLPHTYNSSQYSTIDERKLSPIEDAPLEQHPHPNKRLEFANKAYELSPLVKGNRLKLKVFHDTGNSPRTVVKFKNNENQGDSPEMIVFDLENYIQQETVLDLEDINQFIPPPSGFQSCDDVSNTDLQKGSFCKDTFEKSLPRATLVHLSRDGVVNTFSLRTGVAPVQVRYQSKAPRVASYDSEISEKIDKMSMQGTLSGIAPQKVNDCQTPFTSKRVDVSLNRTGMSNLDIGGEERGTGSPLALRRGIRVPPLVFVPEFIHYSPPSSTSSPSDSVAAESKPSSSQCYGESEPYTRRGNIDCSIAPYRVPTSTIPSSRQIQVPLVEWHASPNRTHYSQQGPSFDIAKKYISRGPPIFEAPDPPTDVPPTNGQDVHVGEGAEEHMKSLECSFEDIYKVVKGKHRSKTPENTMIRKYRNAEDLRHKSVKINDNKDSCAIDKGKLCASDSGWESSNSSSKIPRFTQKSTELQEKFDSHKRTENSCCEQQMRDSQVVESIKHRSVSRIPSPKKTYEGSSALKKNKKATNFSKPSEPGESDSFKRTENSQRGTLSLKSRNNLKSIKLDTRSDCTEQFNQQKGRALPTGHDASPSRETALPTTRLASPESALASPSLENASPHRALKIPKSYNENDKQSTPSASRVSEDDLATKTQEVSESFSRIEKAEVLMVHGVAKISKDKRKPKKTDHSETPERPKSRIPRFASGTRASETPVKPASKSSSGGKIKGSTEEKQPVRISRTDGGDSKKGPVQKGKTSECVNEKRGANSRDKVNSETNSEKVPVKKALKNTSENSAKAKRLNFAATKGNNIDVKKSSFGNNSEKNRAWSEESTNDFSDVVRQNSAEKKGLPAKENHESKPPVTLKEKITKSRGESKIPGLIKRNLKTQAVLVRNKEVYGKNSVDSVKPQARQYCDNTETICEAIVYCKDNETDTCNEMAMPDADTETDSVENVNKIDYDTGDNLAIITNRSHDSEVPQTQLKLADKGTAMELSCSESFSENETGFDQLENSRNNHGGFVGDAHKTALSQNSRFAADNLRNFITDSSTFGLREKTAVNDERKLKVEDTRSFQLKGDTWSVVGDAAKFVEQENSLQLRENTETNAGDITIHGVKLRRRVNKQTLKASSATGSMENEFASSFPEALILGSVQARRKRSTEERQNARNRIALQQRVQPLEKLEETTTEVLKAFVGTSAEDFKTTSEEYTESRNERLSVFENQLRDLLLVNDVAQEVESTKCFYVPELKELLDFEVTELPSVWESAEELLTNPLVPERSIKVAKIAQIPKKNYQNSTSGNGTDATDNITKNIGKGDRTKCSIDDVRVGDDIPHVSVSDVRGSNLIALVDESKISDDIPRKDDFRVHRRGLPSNELSPQKVSSVLSCPDSITSMSDRERSSNASPDIMSPLSASSVSLSDKTLEFIPQRKLSKHGQFPPRKGRKNAFCSPVRSRKKSKEIKSRYSDEVYQDSTEDENRSPERKKNGSLSSPKKERISSFFSKSRIKSRSESEDSTSEMSSGNETLKGSFLKGLKRGKKQEGATVTERSSSPLARLKLKKRQNSKDSSTSDLDMSPSPSPAKLEEEDTLPELPSVISVSKTRDHRQNSSSLGSRHSLTSVASRHSNASLLSRLSQISSRASLDWDPSLQLTDCHFDHDFMPPPPPPPPGDPPLLPDTPPTASQDNFISCMNEYNDKVDTVSLSSTVHSRGSMEWDPTGIQLRLSLGPGDDRVYYCQEGDFDEGPTTSL